MGYTHYWKSTSTPTKEKFDEFYLLSKKLHDNLPANTLSGGGYYADSPLKIAGGNGKGKPLFGDVMNHEGRDFGRCVFFNGEEGGEEDLSHETFAIFEDEPSDDFCKTNRKPYDLLVCACLIAANKIFNFEIKTDGSMEDWEPAFKFYASVIGETQISAEIKKGYIVFK